MEAARLEVAAVSLQAAYRGAAAVRTYARTRQLLVRLQAGARRRLAQYEVDRLRAAGRAATQRAAAATALQCAVRRLAAQRHLAALQASAQAGALTLAAAAAADAAAAAVAPDPVAVAVAKPVPAPAPSAPAPAPTPTRRPRPRGVARTPLPEDAVLSPGSSSVPSMQPASASRARDGTAARGDLREALEIEDERAEDESGAKRQRLDEPGVIAAQAPAAQAPAGDRLVDAPATDWVIYGLVAATIAAIWMYFT